MMKMNFSSRDKYQLAPSIEKLFHYLFVYSKYDTLVKVTDGDNVVFNHTFIAPKLVSISPTLYTRIDSCHGAGNCCRVEFDLVYTNYDYLRIIDYNHSKAVDEFGVESAKGFKRLRDVLLKELISMDVECEIKDSGSKFSGMRWQSKIWVQRNITKNILSGKNSCPYLVVGGDRYFCGVHPFKPLHCWYPHMTVRQSKAKTELERPTVSIGRMQYGRNHNFGCPVIFDKASYDDVDTLFGPIGKQGKSYFEKQFQDDYDKLQWTAMSAESIGLLDDVSLASNIHDRFLSARKNMELMISSGENSQIELWKNYGYSTF